MNIEDLKELHYITHIENIPSIIEHGILSHNLILRKNIPIVDISSSDIQNRRRGKKVPGTNSYLHDYVNLYINARNPMLYVLSVLDGKHNTLCIIRINKSIINEGGVIITDGNAARDMTQFSPALDGLLNIDKSIIFSKYWNDEDEIEKYRKKGIMCSEVLVPEKVNKEHLLGGYVCSNDILNTVCEKINSSEFKIDINKSIFFK